EKLFDAVYLSKTLVAFILLCFLSSAVYIINDIADIKKDQLHPKKKFRPIPAGILSTNVALVAAVVLLLVAFGGSLVLDSLPHALAPGLFPLALFYFILNVLYSFWLKNVVILDTLIVAAGFIIRVTAGAVLVDARRFSPWLYVCMTLLALFIVLGKRRREITLLANQADSHRAVLANYNLPFIDQMIGVVSTSTIIAYSFYTFSAENLPKSHAMMLTIPFVLYGIFRYLYLIHVKNEGGAPDELVFKDRPLLFNFILWGIAAVSVLYLLK
ncbi:MAG: decaprenyl-phosphate phosphoribosyltransferase, partial [Chloroflexi bacterium]|nr:decaprenyl-phosphate phosphoribosyltransferase [Chloroflexota bacterium]